MGATSIELHTGDYANAVREDKRGFILNKMHEAAVRAHQNGLSVHAGHGLDTDNYPAFGTAVPHLKEVSIGFAIVARSIFIGMKAAVEEMNAVIASTTYSGDSFAKH